MFLHHIKCLQMHRIFLSSISFHKEFSSKLTNQPNYIMSKELKLNELYHQPKVVCEQEFLVDLKNDPDIFGYRITKNMLDKGDQEEEKFTKEKVLQSHQLTTKQYASIIKSLIEQRKIKEAIDILDIKMLKEDQVKPENYIYNLLLSACAKVGYTKKAFSLYNDMKKRGLKVTGGTYTSLFNACANSPWAETDGLTKAKHLRITMFEKMYEPNESNYNVMIKAFGRCGDLSTAFNIVDEMMSKDIRLNSDTINFLLQACITDKESGFRHALLVWRKMIKLNIKPSIFTFNLMLRTIRDCCLGNTQVTQDVISKILTEQISESSNKLLLGDTDEKLLVEMKKSAPLKGETQVTLNDELNPNLMAVIPSMGNLISYSEIKKASERLLLVGGLRGYLETMKRSECDPTIKTYTLLLDVIPNTAAAENELLSVMKKSKVLLDIDFFNMVMKKRSLRQDYQSAKDILKLMKKKYNFRPNLITYGVLALGCKSKNEALELLTEMKSSKYRLNTEILGALLHQGCYHKNFPYVLEIMETCIRDNVQPNKKFIEHLDNFKKICRQIIKNKDDLGQSKSFQKGFQIFVMRYKIWLTQVKIKDSDETSPWQQFNQSSDSQTDKYYKEKDRASKFKPRRTSKFGLKTSPKYLADEV